MAMIRPTHLAWGILAASAAQACMPPPLGIGHVVMDPSGRGGVDIQGQLGGGAEFLGPSGGGGGAVHVETFVSEKVSFPIGAGVVLGGGSGSGVGGFAPVRVGVRHRAGRHVAWGGGIGPSLIFGAPGPIFSGVADLEVIAGASFRTVGFSVGLRPAFSFEQSAEFTWFALVEPSLAFPVGPASLTVSLLGGPWVTRISNGGHAEGGFLGAAFGVHRRF